MPKGQVSREALYSRLDVHQGVSYFPNISLRKAERRVDAASTDRC